MIRLSHSAIEKYKTCPQMYKLHYKDRIREEQIGSALFFGSAIDEALNEMLKTKMPAYKGAILNPTDVFLEKMTKFQYNNETIEFPFTLKARYLTSDYDEDLITDGYIPELCKYLVENGYENDNPIEVMRQIQGCIKSAGFSELDETDKIFYNYASWLSLCIKGRMMLSAYKKDLLPKIDEVLEIQKEITLPNSKGDKITGFIDFKATLKGFNEVFVCDNKTSSRKYKDDAVQESQQLCIYSEAEETDFGAFFVIVKKVKKTKEKTCTKCGEITFGREKTCKNGGKNRCNGEFNIKTICSIETQFIPDEITEQQKDLTFGTFCDILTNIREENFPKLDKKECFHYGRKCPYYERCYGKDRNSLEGLVKLEEK